SMSHARTCGFALVALLPAAGAGAQPRAVELPAPETYEVYDRWNAPVFATGAIVFTGSYGGSVLVAASSTNPAAEHLYVPVVGPWLALDGWGACPIDEPRCDRTTTSKVLLIADGLFQAAGVVTMLTGLVSPSSRTVVVAERPAT